MERHHALTLKFYEKAAQSMPEALYNLAYMHEFGEGSGKPSLAKAKQYNQLLITKSLNGSFQIENLAVGYLNKLKL